ncbi:MAG: TetR/AcrR family transcriptional regulator [Chloroflexi bacterium]|nr:TetR/AcrR family transcriptional regulator [Chloroflexota bacterium]
MTKRGEDTRARLIEATRRVVRGKGYARASTRAIALAAGVAEGTIYRHFPDKSSLFLAAILEANAPLIAWFTSLPTRAGQDEVEDNLTDAALRLAGMRDAIIPLELAIMADPELAAQRRGALSAAGSLPPGPPDAIASYLAAEQRLGRVRPDVDPREAAIVILAVLFGLVADPSFGDGSLGRERLSAAMRLIVRGIEPPVALA